ncbi:hypothetical protein G7085_12470 [Tessaracoccus sp. HDW20]|uniref:ABC transporter permease n=1 Tax=Tessaracoccus coleopterorum TaxID=2714950 RepID=UPI0018D34568|nr:hypothetical protein [Tessaracoccus coleopterorum]NHB85160.1 hypothetical protein [Tessaracoccus coleopterorum]
MNNKVEHRADVHVYTPHKAGLPRMREYFGDLWRRRDFAMELAHTNMRAANTNTVLGQLWLVVNPLLLAGVYYLLVVVLSGANGKNADFPQIAGGLFLFFLITGIVQSCATSVTNSGSLVLNMSFPKLLLILSNTYLAVRRYLPTLLVYLVIHLFYQRPITWSLLWIPSRSSARRSSGWGSAPWWPRPRCTSVTPRSSCPTSSASGCTPPRCSTRVSIS